MAETVTVTIEMGIGYSGNSGKKSYIARIDGTDKQFIFSREFIATEATDKNEMFTARRKRKGTWTEAAALEPGLYERQWHGDRTYLVIWIKDGVPTRTNISVERAQRMAILMDDGQTCEESRLATKPEPKADVAAEPKQ